MCMSHARSPLATAELPAVVRPPGVRAQDGLQVPDTSRRRGPMALLRCRDGAGLPLPPLL